LSVCRQLRDIFCGGLDGGFGHDLDLFWAVMPSFFFFCHHSCLP
jgi:hypothetical protein